MHVIAEEMKVVVQSRPDLSPKPATGAVLAARVKLCGLPNPEQKARVCEGLGWANSGLMRCSNCVPVRSSSARATSA